MSRRPEKKADIDHLQELAVFMDNTIAFLRLMIGIGMKEEEGFLLVSPETRPDYFFLPFVKK